MPLFVGDYLADTTHLTCTEHGAYILLLMAMWRAGGTLPADPAKLARFARCTSGQWARISDTILAFFDCEGGAISHGRLTREMTKHTVAVEQRRQAASNGGKAKAQKTLRNVVPDASVPLCQPEPEPEKKDTPTEPIGSAAPKGAGPRRGSKSVPESWSPSVETMRILAFEGHEAGAIERALTMMRDHEFRTARSDWDKTFRNWVREDAKRQPRKAPHERSQADAKYDARQELLATHERGADAAARRWHAEHG